MKISILIPLYNEEKTIAKLVKMVEEIDLPHDKETIIIDDHSTDSTRKILEDYEGRHKVILKDKNEGKGSALKEGFKHFSGDVVIIQDADLEYNPADYQTLLEPIINGYADVVYGSRFISSRPRRVLYFSHYLGNKLITSLSNLFTGLNLSDMETGYKAFSGEALKKIYPGLKSKRFGFEPEITAKVAKAGLRVYEVGISYNGRAYNEGKKINWVDGLAAIWHIIRFNIFDI